MVVDYYMIPQVMTLYKEHLYEYHCCSKTLFPGLNFVVCKMLEQIEKISVKKDTTIIISCCKTPKFPL